jgi:hypothetical protein
MVHYVGDGRPTPEGERLGSEESASGAGVAEPCRPWGLVGYNLPLAHGVGPDRHLRARCASCARLVVFDPAPWIAARLGSLPLASFETRLRCLCGARRASLEIWTGPAPGHAGDNSIYAFR